MEPHKPKSTLTTALLLLAMTFAAPASQAATLYKWTDAEGNTHYSQTPPEDGTAEKMHVSDKPAQQPAEDGPPEGSGQDPKRAEIRQKNCEIAHRNLKVYKSSERIKQEDGTILTLSDEMREAKIKDAQEKIEEFCP